MAVTSGLNQAEASSQEFIQGSHRVTRDSGSWAMICCFSGALAGIWIRIWAVWTQSSSLILEPNMHTPQPCTSWKKFFFNFGYTLSVFKAYLMCVCMLLTDVAYFLLLYLFNTIFSQQFFIYLVFPAYDFPTHKLSPAFINLSVAVGILSISSSQFLT